jgi:hypothetical protein
LVVVKELGLNPSEIGAGPVSVKFNGIAPPGGQAPAQNNAELEAKIRELQAQIQNRPSPQESNQLYIGGWWKSSFYDNVHLHFTQSGNRLAMAVYVYGIPTAAGQGYVNRRNLRVDYMNSAMLPGVIECVISDDGSRLNLVDYGTGGSDVLYRQ